MGNYAPVQRICTAERQNTKRRTKRIMRENFISESARIYGNENEMNMLATSD